MRDHSSLKVAIWMRIACRADFSEKLLTSYGVTADLFTQLGRRQTQPDWLSMSLIACEMICGSVIGVIVGVFVRE